MNCEDISRIADRGRFSNLTEGERREAEAHALTCARCAPVWGAHARLATLRIPAMPVELSMRCRTLATLPARPAASGRRRRAILIGTLLAVAAAAGILMMQWHGRDAAELRLSITSPADPLPAPVAASIAAVTAPMDVPRILQDETIPENHGALPLLPMPVEADPRAAQDLALQKLVERHPELVTGPAIEGTSIFMAAMSMRPDGDVVSSKVRNTAGLNAYELDHELYMTLPQDAGTHSIPRYKKGTKLPDGRSLRADIILQLIVLPTAYNASRSTMRVRQILGNKYSSLMLPSAGSGDNLNRLTILLAEDGTIVSERTEPERPDPAFSNIRADDPRDVERYAAGIANLLSIDVKQIGLMGSTYLEDGTIKLLDNGEPGGYVDDKLRKLLVRYAWVRGSGESGPILKQDGSTAPKVDMAAALAIVEQQIPDAFTPRDAAAGTPMVVMSAEGKFLKAGRVQMAGSTDMIAGQLVAGIKVKPSSFTRLRVRDKAGRSADVVFVWEMPQDAARP